MSGWGGLVNDLMIGVGLGRGGAGLLLPVNSTQEVVTRGVTQILVGRLQIRRSDVKLCS